MTARRPALLLDGAALRDATLEVCLPEQRPEQAAAPLDPLSPVARQRRSSRWRACADISLLGALPLVLPAPVGAAPGTSARIAVSCVLVCVWMGLNTARPVAGPARRAGTPHRLWRLSPAALLLALLVQPLLDPGAPLRAHGALLLAVPTLAALSVIHLAHRALSPSTRVRQRVLVVGTGAVALRAVTRLSRCPQVEVIGVVDTGEPPTDALLPDVVGPIADLARLCSSLGVERLVVAVSGPPDEVTLDAVQSLQQTMVTSVVVPAHPLLSWRSAVEELHGLPLVTVPPRQPAGAAVVVKRCLDVVVALVALVLLAPLLLGIAIAIRCTSPGPVLFRQRRTGRGRREFEIYKFRTMRQDAMNERTALAAKNAVDGPIFKLWDDPRVTPLGKVLRRTSLDELPQLVNVLRGDMSLVGPRPFWTEESRRIRGRASRRFDVPPGMTGLWQTSGRSELGYDDLRDLDCAYASSWSLGWDLRILLLTPGRVLRRGGAA